ncbi:Protein kinase-like domain containing protein [Amanita muscaria]
MNRSIQSTLHIMAHEYLEGSFKATIETASDMGDSNLTGQIECTSEFIAPIVVKVMKLVLPPMNEKQKKRQSKQTKRELELWRKISHKNILPLLGIAYINPDTNIPAFISPWMENGNARQFRLRNPSFPPLLILYDIMQGLHYLHTFEPEIVHGDVKAVNVLINDRYEARLCDFGFGRFLVDSTLWRTTATQAGGSLCWMSPELITGKQLTPTKESDMYAYAMTCYEIISGDVPFKSVRFEANLIYNVTVEKQRPELVESRDLDGMWDIITQCWVEEPEDRPRTAEVLELVRVRTSPYSFSIGRSHSPESPAPTIVNNSNYYTPDTYPLPESNGKTVLTMSTNRSYLSVRKILETAKDERMVEGSLIEPASRRYLNVDKVLEK